MDIIHFFHYSAMRLVQNRTKLFELHYAARDAIDELEQRLIEYTPKRLKAGRDNKIGFLVRNYDGDNQHFLLYYFHDWTFSLWLVPAAEADKWDL